MGYSFRLAARVLLYASSHTQDNIYHNLCYTRPGALAETRYSPMGPPWGIDPMTHYTMSEHSYHGATLWGWGYNTKTYRRTMQYSYRQVQTSMMLPDMWMFAEPLSIGFGCITTTQEALMTDLGQANWERPPQPKIDTSGWCIFGIDLGQQPSQLAKFLD